MTRKAFLSLIALIPVHGISYADPNRDTDAALTALQGWSVEQLCGARDNADAWAELERRDIFASRELRVIRKGNVRTGISEEALICSRGLPETTLPVPGWAASVQAYIYPPGATDGLVAYVSHGAEESEVALSVPTDDPAALVADATTRLVCTRSNGRTSCRLASGNSGPLDGGCGTGMPIIPCGAVVQYPSNITVPTTAPDLITAGPPN